MGTADNSAALRAEIEAAFADVARPPESDMATCECDDDCRFLLQGLAGKDWCELTRDDLGDSTNELVMALSPAGFRYYLPALMLLVLSDAEGAEMLPYDLLARFTFQSAEQRECVQQTIETLNAGQRAVVAGFLRFVQQQDACLCPTVTASAVANLESDRLLPYSQVDVDAWVRHRLG